jgi:hypothetical protein
MKRCVVLKTGRPAEDTPKPGDCKPPWLCQAWGSYRCCHVYHSKHTRACFTSRTCQRGLHPAVITPAFTTLVLLLQAFTSPTLCHLL